MTKLGTLRHLDEALPGLWAARETGRLVPFVGAGLSRPHCRSWPDFVGALYGTFGATMAAGTSGSNPEALYRSADRVASWLRLLPTEERRARLREALHDPASPDLPSQAVALASFAWPLVVTTNYDDVVPRSLRQRHRKEPRILGRSTSDCAQVVRSLDALDDPIVWYVQGHIGAGDIVAGAGGSGPTPSPLLLDELVVGHQQYQHAINSGQTFRRAFSEVFRRRSLLFVGSGLAESYFVNLIAESLLSLGPSGQPHFALFSDKDLHRVDVDFLAVRLGITPVRYGSTHADLPDALERLAHSGATATRAPELPRMRRVGFSVARAEVSGSGEELDVDLRYGRVRPPGEGGCVVLSVGRDRRGDRFEPGVGEQVLSFLDDYDPSTGLRQFACSDVQGLPQGRMFRVQRDGQPLPIFLLVARELDDRHDDEARSLAAITEATVQALQAVEQAGFRYVAMGLMAAGPMRADAAPYCLVAQLSGIREFAASRDTVDGGLASVEINVLDRQAWAALAQGRIPVLDLLSSRLSRVLVRVADGRGATEEYALSVAHGTTVDEVLGAYRIGGAGIVVTARPLPRRVGIGVLGMAVFPGMVIEVSPSE